MSFDIAAFQNALARRAFLAKSGIRLGAAALATGLGTKSFGRYAVGPGAPGPHLPARAKNVIYIQICGGPSQLDLFDYKPELRRRHGEDVPSSFWEGERFAFIDGTKKLLGSPFRFRQWGQSGAWVSELLPHLSRVVDQLCFIKSVQTDQFNHGPAQIFLNTGFASMGKPSMGAWVTYGLGSENADLPAYVVIVPGMRNAGGQSMWGSGFLPARYQGVEFKLRGESIPFIENPAGVDRSARQDTVETIRAFNAVRGVSDPGLDAALANYEMAFRMQASIPELMDLDAEPKSVHQHYGTETSETAFARSLLLARRLVERGVRFVQVCYEGEPGVAIWDSHGDTKRGSLEFALPYLCRQIDQPTAALIEDLRVRGMLEETLVIWGGEFGRTPMNEDRPGAAEPGYSGRDHWPKAGTMWLAGGGVAAGSTIGATDELGFRVVERPVHLHDLNATILHLLGLDHLRLNHRFQGRDFRLTDVHGELVPEMIAT